MKEIKKGYRLTAEEEKIVRGETPGGGTEHASEPGKRRGVQALLPLVGLFVLMIGLAWGFLFLSGGERPAADNALTEGDGTVIPEEQKAVFTEKLHLTAEESAAFWPLYTRFCTEIESVRRQHLEWLARQRPENPENLPLEEFMASYTTDYRQFDRTVLRYSEAFAALLGGERVPAVFLLYEEWQGGKSAVNR